MTTAPTEPSRTLAASEVDPLEIANDAASIEGLCSQGIARAEAALGELRDLGRTGRAAREPEAVASRLDEIRLALTLGGGAPHLLGEVHPDAALREAARGCEPRLDRFDTELMLDADFAAAVRMAASSSEPREPASARLLEHALRDLRRNGLELPAAGQARLRELNDALTLTGQAFGKNLAEARGELALEASKLDGLPPEYVEAKRAGALADGRVVVTTDYPDYMPFIRFARDRGAALSLYEKFENRAYPANVELLERLLALREEKAKLLGYANWADYAIEPRMAKRADVVRAFLSRVKGAVRARAAIEMDELRAAHVALGGKADDPLHAPDRLYLEEHVRRARYACDARQLSQYFPVERVREGVLAVVGEVFGVELLRVDGPAWHDDVAVYEVREAGRALGRVHLDLYPREAKYKHAAVFGVRPTKRYADGSRLLPVAVLVCNFPKPSASAPALLLHEEVVTFFHELGHVLHQLLSETRLASFAGTATARDFVETPSQAFEEWAWRREVLDRVAGHHETGAKIPDSLFEAMTRARGFGRALATERQLFLAALDLEFHTRPAGFDSTKVLEEIWDAWQPFAFLPGTHFQGTFGHLVGYDAGYYGYQWALSLARDVLSRFEGEGFFSTATATAFRREILARGGEEDETELVTRFLGRAPDERAYVAHLASG